MVRYALHRVLLEDGSTCWSRGLSCTGYKGQLFEGGRLYFSLGQVEVGLSFKNLVFCSKLNCFIFGCKGVFLVKLFPDGWKKRGTVLTEAKN